MICQQWHFEDWSLVAFSTTTVVLKPVAWRGVSFQRTRSHAGQELRTGASVGWGGAEYRPAQNPEARSLPCLAASTYFSRLSPFSSLGSPCGFGSKDLPCRKTRSIRLLYPNRLKHSFLKRPGKIKWYVMKSRTSAHRDSSAS